MSDLGYEKHHHSRQHSWQALRSKTVQSEVSYDALPDHPHWRERHDIAVRALTRLTTDEEFSEMIDALPSAAFGSWQTYALTLERLLEEKKNKALQSGAELER